MSSLQEIMILDIIKNDTLNGTNPFNPNGSMGKPWVYINSFNDINQTLITFDILDWVSISIPFTLSYKISHRFNINAGANMITLINSVFTKETFSTEFVEETDTELVYAYVRKINKDKSGSNLSQLQWAFNLNIGFQICHQGGRFKLV